MWQAWERRQRHARFLVLKTQNRKPVRPGSEWQDTIKISLRENEGVGLN